MTWLVEFDGEFKAEFDGFAGVVKIELLARAKVLEKFGPSLGRPSVDTLAGSAYRNMKELRFNADGGAWRIAFAFDPERKAILLCGGDKAGKNQRRFYERLVRIADQRFKAHLTHLGDYKETYGQDIATSN